MESFQTLRSSKTVRLSIFKFSFTQFLANEKNEINILSGSVAPKKPVETVCQQLHDRDTFIPHIPQTATVARAVRTTQRQEFYIYMISCFRADIYIYIAHLRNIIIYRMNSEEMLALRGTCGRIFNTLPWKSLRNWQTEEIRQTPRLPVDCAHQWRKKKKKFSPSVETQSIAVYAVQPGRIEIIKRKKGNNRIRVQKVFLQLFLQNNIFVNNLHKRFRVDRGRGMRDCYTLITHIFIYFPFPPHLKKKCTQDSRR